jgi:hypothetical protein
MPFAVFGFIAFVLVTLGVIAWAAVWLVFALLWLLWPVALLVLGVAAWRRRPVGPAARPTVNARNSAFEDYRRETVERLDEEQGQFGEFLGRLRRSKDKQEFDAYMAGRRGRDIEDLSAT